MQRLKTVLVDDRKLGVNDQNVADLGSRGTMLCQGDGTILSLDKRAFLILDLDAYFLAPKDVVGKKVSDLVQCPVSCDVLCKQATPELRATCLEHPVRTPKNNHKWLLYAQQLQTEEETGREYVRSMIWDTTSCRCKQKEVAQERDFFAGVVHHSAAATFVLDRDHRIIVWNKACEHLTGIKASDIEGTDKHWKAFYHEKRPCLADILVDEELSEIPKLYEHYRRSAITPDGWRVEGWIQGANGRKRYVVSDAAPIHTEQKEVLAVIQTIEDITGHKQAENELSQKREEVLELQKMEAVGRLAGGIAHDFNNLLTTILGYSNLIKDGMEIGTPQRAEVQEIITAGERASKLTKQLLALGMKQMIKTTPVNLNAVVMNMGRLLRRTLGEHIELKLDITQKLGNIMADEALLEQVIMNLATNAGAAMPTGGTLTIRTANLTLGDTYLAGDTSISSGHYTALSIRDTGCGMTPEIRSHIFEPFFTTKPRGKATGLGLSTAYGIVQQLKGHIDVASEPGMGTSFTMYFPIVDEPVPEKREPSTQGLATGTETILVVEDEEAVRRLIVRTLTGLGYYVLEAADGSEGLKVADEYKDTLHLILSDVVMPHLGGQEMVKVLRGMRDDFKVLFSSGFTNGSLVDNGLLEGTDELIFKPFTRESLAAKVRQVLDAD